jgi:hypothetical protein
MSVTAGNKLVSKEVSVCYRGNMLQQAGYQRSSLPRETPLETFTLKRVTIYNMEKRQGLKR